MLALVPVKIRGQKFSPRRVIGFCSSHPAGSLLMYRPRIWINILDTDIKIMYAESHHAAELTQMAGRVRNSLEKFFVLYDAVEHVSNTNRYNERLEYHCVDSANKTYDDYTQYFGNIGKPFPKEESSSPSTIWM